MRVTGKPLDLVSSVNLDAGILLDGELAFFFGVVEMSDRL